MKFIKRVSITLFILLVVFVGLLWWLPAPVIKWAIEYWGTQAVGAKVEVESVEFNWFPTHVAINNLAVTNPRKPMFNALVIQELSTDIQLMPALSGQYYFDLINVYGIAVDAKRQKSGAIDQASNNQTEKKTAGQFTPPDLDILLPKEMIEQEKKIYQEKIAAFKSKLEVRKEKWQLIVDDLPDDERLKELEEEWHQVDKGSVLEKITKAKRLRDKVKQDYKKLKSSESEIRTEYEQLQQEYNNLKALSGQSTREIVAQLGLSDSVIANLSANLLDGVVQQWIAKGLGYYDILAPQSDEPSSDQDADDTNQAPKTAPAFLVKVANITGPFQWQGKAGEIVGKVTHVSDAPTLYDQPMGLDIRAQGELLGNIELNGEFDHRQQPSSDRLSMKAQGVVLATLPVVVSEKLDLSLLKPTLNMTTNAQVASGTQLKATFNSELSGYSVAISGDDAQSAWVKSLSQALTENPSLTLNGSLSGSLTSPALSLKSNLDSVLKKALKSGVDDKISALRQDVKNELEQILIRELGSVEQPLAGVEGLFKQLDMQTKAFGELSGNLK